MQTSFAKKRTSPIESQLCGNKRKSCKADIRSQKGHE
jgi:hypothetical protein